MRFSWADTTYLDARWVSGMHTVNQLPLDCVRIRLTDTGQKTPDRGYTKQIDQEQSCADD